MLGYYNAFLLQHNYDAPVRHPIPKTIGKSFFIGAQVINSGASHSCNILTDSRLSCWGDNFYGQLGIGTNIDSTVQRIVDLGVGRSAVSISLGQSHTCAILDNGNLKCWGKNSFGQLGDQFNIRSKHSSISRFRTGSNCSLCKFRK